MDDKGPSISVITVTWNSASTIEACLAPLTDRPDLELVVVDNDSEDDTLEIVRRTAPAATLVRTGANCGFAVGVNAGAAAATGDALVLLNPDAIADPDDLRKLVDRLPRAAIVAPRILGPDGEPTRSIRSVPTVRGQFAVALGLHRLGQAFDPDDDAGALAATGPTDAAVVSGACLAIEASRFRELGGLDERFFLYGEEVDLCIRIAAAGETIEYHPECEVSHIGGVSAQRTGASTDFIMFESRVRLFAKHRGRASAQAVRLALLVLAARRRDGRALRAMGRPIQRILTPSHPTLAQPAP